MGGERRFIRRGPGGILIARVNAQHYGHHALEMLMALDDARRTGLPLYFLPQRQSVNPALFHIEAEGATFARPGPVARLWLALVWRTGHVAEILRQIGFEWSEPARAAATRQLRRAARHDAGRWVRRPLRRLADRIAGMTTRARGERPYMRRLAMRVPLQVRLSAEAAERAERAADALGIAADARLVVIHAREAGFKRGREVHDSLKKRRHDDLRNARIETYFQAIDCLVRAGYTVVRVGDPSMTPIRRAGLIDVATDPRHVPELDLYLLLRCQFAIVGESGPGQVALLTNTPTLTLNATDPISSFPVRRDGLYILKRVREIATGRVLPVREMLGFEYLRHIRNPARFEYIDNTPEEIVDAVQEISLVASGCADQESPLQAAYKQQACRASEEFRDRLQYIRKHGADQGFLGDGRIGRAFVERYWT